MSRGEHGLDVTTERLNAVRRKLDSAGLVYVDEHERHLLAMWQGTVRGLLHVCQCALLVAGPDRMPAMPVRLTLANATTSLAVQVDQAVASMSESRRKRAPSGALRAGVAVRRAARERAAADWHFGPGGVRHEGKARGCRDCAEMEARG